MGIESQQGSYQAHTASTNTGAANRDKLKNAGYGGVRFRDTKGGRGGGTKTSYARQPNWSDAGIPTEPTGGPTTQAGPKTTEEVLAYRSKGGIAPTAKSMGSLSVQFRANNAADIKAGVQTDTNKQDQKIIDARDTGPFGRKGRNTALDGFKKKYWEAREVWAADKGAYSGIVPSGSEVSHSKSRQLQTPSSRRLTSKAPSSGVRPNATYGLF